MGEIWSLAVMGYSSQPFLLVCVMDKKSVWRKATKEFLDMNCFCAECDKRNYIVPASKVAHIKPSDNSILFWDMNNWIQLCDSCYTRSKQQVRKVPDLIHESAKFYTVA